MELITDNHHTPRVLVHGKPNTELRRALRASGYSLAAITGQTTIWLPREVEPKAIPAHDLHTKGVR